MDENFAKFVTRTPSVGTTQNPSSKGITNKFENLKSETYIVRSVHVFSLLTTLFNPQSGTSPIVHGQVTFPLDQSTIICLMHLFVQNWLLIAEIHR